MSNCKQFQSSLLINYSRFSLCFLFIIKMHFQCSFLCLHFSHYQKPLQFLHYTLTDQQKLFHFQEQLSFQGTLYNFSSTSATSSYTFARNYRIYPIFNKLVRYSLRWHHQLSKSFRLCWRIKKKTNSSCFSHCSSLCQSHHETPRNFISPLNKYS